MSCFVHLKDQGKEFALECGLVDDGPAFIEEYERVSTAINARKIPQADLDRIWQESEPYQKAVEFSAAVLAKGFVAPIGLS